MSRKKIEIVIDEEGNSNIEAFGYKDGSCKKATREFEEALGKVTNRKIKDQECDVKTRVKV